MGNPVLIRSRHERLRRWLAASFIALAAASAALAGGPPKNVVLMIGDGMGFEHLKAAGMYANGKEGTLAMEQLPHKASVTTHAADCDVTDSAAAATAMATGCKVNSYVLSMRIPGDRSPLTTLVELAQSEGKTAGVVTTTFISHATPAAFIAHCEARDDYAGVARQCLTKTRPNVLFGGVAFAEMGITPESAKAAGYAVVTDRRSMQALQPGKATFVSGQFSEGYMPYEHRSAEEKAGEYDEIPHLSEMAAKALELLGASDKGFFLMVEGGRIDHAAHNNALPEAVLETVEFDNAVRAAMKWSAARKDTLLIVTADHETGGLKVLRNNGKGSMPEVRWSGADHTGVNVPLFARGVGAEAISGTIDNTDVFRLARGTHKAAATASPAAGPTATAPDEGALIRK